MAISTREDFIAYCLRKLGAPVVRINVDDTQVEDRVDDAITYFNDFCADGQEKVYIKRKLTATSLTCSGVITGTFTKGETVTGGTSGAKGTVIDQAANNLSIRIRVVSGTFVNSETITGGTSGATGTLAASNALTLGDLDNRWIPITDSVLSIINIFPVGDYFSGDMSMFDMRYQMALGAMLDLSYTDMQQYVMLRSHMSLIEYLFTGQKGLRYNRYQNKLHIDFDWASDAQADRYIVIEAWSAIDPATYTRAYNNAWLQDYATAKIKQQWGTNLKKMSGLQLPGGVTLNGQQIYDEATNELAKLEDDARKIWSEPVSFIMG